MTGEGLGTQRRSLVTALAEMQAWRERTVEALAALRRWALVHRLTDDPSATRLAYLERRLATDRISIAFLAQSPGGERQLVDALFPAQSAPGPLSPVMGHTAKGLAIIDLACLDAPDTESEQVIRRLSEADGVVAVLPPEAQSPSGERVPWREWLEPIAAIGQTRLLVLDGIDARADAGRAEAMMVGLVQARGEDHATSARAEVRTLFAEARALLDSRREFVAQALDELGSLQARNARFVESRDGKVADDRTRAEGARIALNALRAVHGRQAGELAKLLDPESARACGEGVRDAVLATRFSAGIGGAFDAYFGELRARIARAAEAIGEVKAMMAAANQRFANSWGFIPAPAADFATDRFLRELDRLEAHCSREIRGAASLVTRGHRTLATLFLGTVAREAVHVFEVAERDVRTWLESLVRPLEAQVNALEEHLESRGAAMARIRDAGSSLAERIDGLQELLRDGEEQLREWESHERSLAALLMAKPASGARAPG